jgi:hypothetical protein
MLGSIHNPYWFKGYLSGRNLVEHSLIRYEDMITDPAGTISVALERMGRPFSEDRLPQAIQENSFERLTGGRKRGKEDRGSHYRKGVVGDWRNYFTREQNRSYFERFRPYFKAFNYSLEGEPAC